MKIRCFHKETNETLWVTDLNGQDPECVFQDWRTRQLRWLKPHIVDEFTYEVI